MTTDVVDIRIFNSEMGIKCMAKYDYILTGRYRRRKTIMGLCRLYQAVRNGYETLRGRKKWTL